MPEHLSVNDLDDPCLVDQHPLQAQYFCPVPLLTPAHCLLQWQVVSKHCYLHRRQGLPPLRCQHWCLWSLKIASRWALEVGQVKADSTYSHQFLSACRRYDRYKTAQHPLSVPLFSTASAEATVWFDSYTYLQSRNVCVSGSPSIMQLTWARFRLTEVLSSKVEGLVGHIV